jgi:hypothetical protein
MKGHLRDTGNTEADWRANRERLGYPGLSSHAFRKTCVTALDVAGCQRARWRSTSVTSTPR